MPPDILEQNALGLVGPSPKEQEVDPETKITKLAVLDHGIYRRKLELSDSDAEKVRKLLKDSYLEWKQNTVLLHNKLRRYNDRLEGVTAPKNFPWDNASNLNIPMTETHIAILHSVVASTVLENDPVWAVKELIPTDVSGERVDPNIEWWLNFVCKKQLHLDLAISEAYWNAFKDPLACAVMDWVEDIGREYRIEVFDSVEEFQKRFPDVESSGLSDKTYKNYIDQLSGQDHDPLQLKIEQTVVKYRGPHIRVVELKDLVRAPVGAPTLEYTVFHGDQFRQRKDWFSVRANHGWFDKKAVKKMVDSAGKKVAIDQISEQQDRIDGISSARYMKADEYDCIRGNLRVALGEVKTDADGNVTEYPEEALYHVVYHPDTDSLLRIEEYPYWHNRINYIVFRIRKRSNRLLGRCIPDMLYDLNEEVITQHNQRIDSRTITTVPSFIVNANETDLDPSRKNQRFYPGVRFKVSNMTNFQQMKITQTDMSSTMQEEGNLFQIAEQLTGVASRTGAPQPRDPRAPAKKAAQQLQQSNTRIDDYIKELRPGTNEIGSQVMELFYQFSPDSVLRFSKYDKETEAWARNSIKRSQLRNRNMTVEVARTTIMDNPDMVMQRALVDWQIWSKEPMVGGNPKRRHALIRRTMFSERIKDISELLPNLETMLKEMQDAQQLKQSHPDMMNAIGDKTGQGESDQEDGNDNLGGRQGGPDVSLGSLKKP